MGTTRGEPVEKPVHRLFVCVRGICPGARKKVCGFLEEVIHRKGRKSVDNPVDNLWTTPLWLWVTGGLPVDAITRHRITEPQATVDNLGKTCGRTCGRGVDKLWALFPVHRRAELPTGSSTGPVDENSRSDLQRQWLSTLSTGPTTTTHLH